MLWCLIRSDGKLWRPDRNRAARTHIGCSSYNCEASCQTLCQNLKVPVDSRSSKNWTSYLLRLDTHRNQLLGTSALSLTWARHCSDRTWGRDQCWYERINDHQWDLFREDQTFLIINKFNIPKKIIENQRISQGFCFLTTYKTSLL